MLAELSGGKLFSKIDMTSAYQQVLLDEDSKVYTAINTQKGLFVYNGLCFGINTAFSIFQRIMENLMKDLNGLSRWPPGNGQKRSRASYEPGKSPTVFPREQAEGKKSPSSSLAKHKLNIWVTCWIKKKGVYPSQDKVRAVHDAPAPTGIKELRFFGGLVNYYGPFVSQQSTVLVPLYNSLKDETTWRLCNTEQDAFIKNVSNSWPATKYHSVIQHTAPDGGEHPVAYASNWLSPAKTKYILKEKRKLLVWCSVLKSSISICGGGSLV